MTTAEVFSREGTEVSVWSNVMKNMGTYATTGISVIEKPGALVAPMWNL